MPASSSHIQQFYAGKSVFITGVTGFLGKVVAERLLRTVPEIGNVYCLVRPQKGVDVAQRLQKIAAANIFDDIRQETPQQLRKLVPIAGDLSLPHLGISDGDQQRLANDCSVVIHSAASVQFNDPIKVATQMNIGGTRKILDLGRSMKNLDALVQVSTAYVNCQDVEDWEVVRQQEYSWQQLLELTSTASDAELDAIQPKLVGRRPNTYTFTKALNEQMIAESANDLPAIIVRPSIIASSSASPRAGWVDNKLGMTGLLAGVGDGSLKVMRGDYDANADIVPVDYVANTLVTAAWYRASKSHTTCSPVINCVSGDLNPVKWQQIIDTTRRYFTQNPSSTAIGPVDFDFKKPTQEMDYQNRKMLVHTIPAQVKDEIAKANGQKPRAMRDMKRLFEIFETVDHFSSYGWRFHSDNLMKMWDSMDAEDQKLYNFDFRKLDWAKYLVDNAKGIQKYVHKHQPKISVPAASEFFYGQEISFEHASRMIEGLTALKAKIHEMRAAPAV